VADTTTVLLVEDNPDDAYFVARQFNNAGPHIQLRTVADGVEAMRYIEGAGNYADRRQYPAPDAILLDLKLPRMNGLDFLEWLRNRSPGAPNVMDNLIPVVVMTSSALPEDLARAHALGIQSYIVKPVNLDEFQQCIAALIDWTVHMDVRKQVER
jgi:CheY-like chemotaxis protein